jgi:uncharacterized Rmd1/YagE family protein
MSSESAIISVPDAARTASKVPPSRELFVHAVLVGDRLTVDRSGYGDVISAVPFCYREDGGYVVVFRYGVVVFVGLPAETEKRIAARFASETLPFSVVEEERLTVEVRADKDEGIASGGILWVKELTPAHVLVIGDILAKSVALARYEREIASVFDTIEPAASALAASGKLPTSRGALLKLIGAALLAQHRVSGRIAFAEKPDILWEHPELERFYARLEDEFEIIERGTLLNGKVLVIGSVAETFTDLMDTARSARLELLVVILFLAELIIGAITLFRP